MYIQKQENGTYRVWVRRRGRSTTATFDRKADAEAYGRKAEVSIESGATIQFRKIKSNTLSDLLRLYRKNVLSKRRHPIQEGQRIRHWLATPLAKRSLNSLSTADFARYRDARKRAGRADNTVRLELAFVSRMYNLARKEWGFDGLQTLSPICKNREVAVRVSVACCPVNSTGSTNGYVGRKAISGLHMLLRWLSKPRCDKARCSLYDGNGSIYSAV